MTLCIASLPCGGLFNDKSGAESTADAPAAAAAPVRAKRAAAEVEVEEPTGPKAEAGSTRINPQHIRLHPASYPTPHLTPHIHEPHT
jgi:hypothetical protein